MSHNQSLPRVPVVVTFFTVFFAAIFPAAAQGPLWTKTQLPSVKWNSVAMSADGSRLLANSQLGPAYLSTDSGHTWQTTGVSAGVNPGNTVACSADGSVLVVAPGVFAAGNLRVSIDAGANWTSRGVSASWAAVACSTNGAKMVAGTSGGQIYVSTDFGTTWTARINLGSIGTIASSADGTRLIAVKGSTTDQMFLSTDSGTTWTPTGPSQPWTAAACSANGLEVIAADLADSGLYNELGGIYRSTDGGASWGAGYLDSATPLNFACAASSADGTHLLVAGSKAGLGPALILTSPDSGATWQMGLAPFNQWTCVAMSADGKKMAATSNGLLNGFNVVANSGGLYTYAEPSTNAPALNIATAGSSAFVSWSWPADGFVLQQNTNLATTNWVTMTNTPSVMNQVIGPATNSNLSYRLVKP